MNMVTEQDIRALLQARGWRQAELAAAIGVSQPTVSRWLGGQLPDPLAQERLRELIGGAYANMPALRPGLQDSGPGRPSPARDLLGERDLAVFAAVEGGPGDLVVSTDPIDIVPRPWFMGAVRDGFAVLVVGESMVPAFRPGDMAIVNPRLAPMRGKEHIFMQESVDGGFIATIKHLRGWTEQEWLLRQFNPPPGGQEEFSLPRALWRRALRVVGKFDG
ncbi:transcriptional regulator with XRE-family HTH domain [Labrys monachus]|uniref:Transcriptional regulator with XRE-family HTH domain n=2 Tax=Labrys monachus TaxID=217067 RepID=A0ABU0FC59_9HYPH|nr:transcriptional regulator with XRE-family HTH domain [Labrys monachus]